MILNQALPLITSRAAWRLGERQQIVVSCHKALSFLNTYNSGAVCYMDDLKDLYNVSMYLDLYSRSSLLGEDGQDFASLVVELFGSQKDRLDDRTMLEVRAMSDKFTGQLASDLHCCIAAIETNQPLPRDGLSTLFQRLSFLANGLTRL